MSTPEEVQEPKSKVPPMPPKQADSAATAERELLIEAVANALCCEHMGALPGAYSLTHEKDCAKGSESAYMWKSARVAVEAMTAHVAAATAKERQARELAEGENARLREALGRIRLLCSSDYNERDPFDQIAPICMEALKP